MLELAKQTLKEGFSCVAARDGAVLAARTGSGIAPLLALYEASPELLAGASVADKVIGRAAATVLVMAGVREVYGEIMSVHGAQQLSAHGIACSCGTEVPRIDNRAKDGMCPMEQSSFAGDSVEENYASLRAFITARDARLAAQAKQG